MNECIYKYLYEADKRINVDVPRRVGWIKQCQICGKIVFVAKLAKLTEMPAGLYYDGSRHNSVS